MEPTITIRVLGPLEVERAGHTVPLRSAKQRALLTALVLADGATVSVDRLVDALWPDDPPPSARNSLQTYVARLRDTLDAPDAIVTRPTGYAMPREGIDVDADRFVAAVSEAQSLLEFDPATARARLTGALSWWSGDAHGEFADAFARSEAVRLSELRLTARMLRSEAAVATGDSPSAITELEALVADEPLREQPARALAEALGRSGRVPEALEVLRALQARLTEELGLDASSAVSALEARLLRGDVGPADPVTAQPSIRIVTPPSPPVRRPPRPATPLLGRDDVLAHVVGALAAGRLTTLVGPGGVGKTRLALEAVLDGETAWVDLGPVREGRAVVPTVADALGLTLPPGADALQGVADAMARRPGVVLLDNCEQVIDAVAELVASTLASEGDGRVLATSRERLGVAGEQVVPVGPLATPDPATATADDPAVRLFLERVSAAGGAVAAPADAAAVCAAVDGLPLAIELAAARAATLPVEDLAARLKERLDVLDQTRPRGADRHRTLRDVVGWSYELLSPADQDLFRRLSVFAGTFRLVDVERICADGDLPAATIGAGLAGLVEQSMVLRAEGSRFRLLETLRRFAAAEFDGSPQAAAVRSRQRAAALELVERARTDLMSSADVAVMAELEAALPDLRAVHARAVASGDLATVARLSAGLQRFAYLQARPDVLEWGEAVAHAGPHTDIPDDLRSGALTAAAAAAWWTGQMQRAVALAEEALALASSPEAIIDASEILGDAASVAGDITRSDEAYAHCRDLAAQEGLTWHLSWALAGCSMSAAFVGDYRSARADAEAAVTAAERTGSSTAAAMALYAHGEALADTDPDRALQSLEAARDAAARTGARFIIGIARTADVALRGRHGDPQDALHRYRDTLALWRDLSADSLIVTALRNLVVLLARVGADARALEVHTATERLGQHATFGIEAQRIATAVRAATERLDPVAAEAARHRGLALTDLAAVAERAITAISETLDLLELNPGTSPDRPASRPSPT